MRLGSGSKSAHLRGAPVCSTTRRKRSRHAMFGRRRRGHPASHPASPSSVQHHSETHPVVERHTAVRFPTTTYDDAAADTAADQFVTTTTGHLIADLNNDSPESTLNKLISCGVTKYCLPLLRRQLRNFFSNLVHVYTLTRNHQYKFQKLNVSQAF